MMLLSVKQCNQDYQECNVDLCNMLQEESEGHDDDVRSRARPGRRGAHSVLVSFSGKTYELIHRHRG